MHDQRVNSAHGSAFAATTTAVAVVQHGNFSPPLAFEGEQPQVTGGNAAPTARAMRGIDERDFGGRHKGYIPAIEVVSRFSLDDFT